MATIDALFDTAVLMQARAYAPYSRFRVGAAVLGASGSVYGGGNVENAAYPVSTCAEQSAIAAMIAAGETAISAVLVLGEGAMLVTPCGGCRQRIREFAGNDVVIHIAGPEGVRASFTLTELLPQSFGPDNLAASDATERLS